MNGILAFLVTLLCAAIGFGLFWFIVTPQQHGMWAVPDAHALRLLVGFAATLFGVLLGSAYRQLARLRESGVQRLASVRSFGVDLVRSVDLWMGLVASPLVYGLLVQSAEMMATSGLVIVALENGFCCLLVVENFLKKPPHNISGGVAGANQ
jgi:hypothetical protein